MELLNGCNLAILKYDKSVGCSPNSLIGLADYTTHFGHLNIVEVPTASIQIPTKFACKDSKTIPLYFIVYRKTQLFLPIRPLNAKSSNQFLQLYSSKLQPKPKYKTYEEFKREADNCCETYNLHVEAKPVLTATSIDTNASSTKTTKNEAVAKIRYSTQNVSKVLSFKNDLIF